MSRVKIIGFVDIEDKRAGEDWTTRFRFEDFLFADHTQLTDPAFIETVRDRARVGGYYPSKKPGSRDGGIFSLVYLLTDAPIPHEIAPVTSVTDGRKTTG